MAEPNYSHFRYFENKYPEIDEFVMVNVKQVSRPAAQRTTASDPIQPPAPVWRR